MKKFLVAAIAAGATPAFAEGTPIDSYFGAIDLTTVAASVVAIGVVVVGICMSEKGISIAKRVIRKA
ncbi:phage coat protein [Vibrio intestinalis]|uniref:phage coat protein n=1 Tax=Vibrio intestinalis TaxID=2933291 RepID=UPI0021A51CBA|nr:phage coat protein [Vibrio intestinalis]